MENVLPESPALHPSLEELEAGVESVRESPTDHGTVQMIVRRPAPGERDILKVGELNREEGLAGDSWNSRPSPRTPDGSPHPDMQLNIMNVRAATLVARSEARWHLAGDQLFVDLDLSYDNLPPHTRLRVGGAVIEVTDQPHTGCRKFLERFGADALRYVNSATGKSLNLRGICAKVVEPGEIRVGDEIQKVDA